MASPWESLESSMAGLSLDDNKLLGKELRRVEHQYLRAQLTDVERKKPQLVQHITQNFILSELKDTLSAISYTGSSYEYTAVPGKSDYDIQYYLKLPRSRLNHRWIYSCNVEECDEAAWRKVKGGPVELLDSDGYLCTEKARTQIQRKIDRALHNEDGSIMFDGYPAYMTRSMHGPATTLNVRWRGIELSIDVVVCLTSLELGDSCGDSFKYDLVGKPFDNYSHRANLWRVSYSKQELEKLRSFHYNDERKLTLLRIMKVIKQHHSQLDHFPSYFYKNLLFKLDEDKPYASWSKPSDLQERFRDFIKEMYHCLQERTLPLHFNKEVNYLENRSSLQIREIAGYLQRVINKNNYIVLVQAVPDTEPRRLDCGGNTRAMTTHFPTVHDDEDDVDDEPVEQSSWGCQIM